MDNKNKVSAYKMARRIYYKIPRSVRIACMVIYDCFAVYVASLVALITRFEFSIKAVEPRFMTAWQHYIWINIIITLVIFFFMKLYSSLWEYASVKEMMNVIAATFIAGCSQMIGISLMGYRMPRSYYVVYTIYLMMMIGFSRFLYRALRTFKNSYVANKADFTIPTMIVGAGDTAYSLVKDINDNNWKVHNKVECIIDADPRKIGSKLMGIPIVGNDNMIPIAVDKYKIQEIFIAIPNIKARRKKEILEICKNTGCKLRILPSMTQIVNDEVTVSKLREVEIEDLLGREPVRTNLDEVMGYIKNRVILVTGAGGSIGSELCRQIASHGPKQLVLFDVYENTTYDLQQELKKNFPELNLVVLIGSVRNTHRIETIFAQYKPEIVFHAAAHKHVPLMEDSPNEAIKNNVFGTYNVARVAGENGVKSMVLISTDKAVNPTNIMGASKKLCEMVMQGMNHRYPSTNFVCVRFGNVLGSNGSVIPLFKKQIAAGGPVTVTDKNIIRYFMTIPEAVSLVLQAGVYAKGGEVFVLDMGEPVKIDDMARNLIKLSGYEPDVDIPIVYTGLRPGEKMFEECLREEEGLEKTENDLIFIGKQIPFDTEEFFEQLEGLKKTAYEDDPQMKEVVHQLIPSYTYKK